MLGPEGITRGIYRNLDELLPQELLKLRAALSAIGDPVTVDELPEVEDIVPYFQENLISIERFPLLMIHVQDTDGEYSNRVTERDGFADEYSFRYRGRVYVIVLGNSEGEAALLSQRMTVAVRSALLRRTKLYTSEHESAALEKLSIQEVFDQVMAAPDRSEYLAASYVSFAATSNELVTTFTEPDPTLTPSRVLYRVTRSPHDGPLIVPDPEGPPPYTEVTRPPTNTD